MKEFTKKLVTEDGSEFLGYGFGADRMAVTELVFNTSMVGYQEILSDPSYTDQTVVMTYPLIGNYGVTDEDFETKFPSIGGMVVRECNDLPSNFRYTKTFSEVLEENGIPGIAGLDTRMLTRMIRDRGTMRCVIVDASMPTPEAAKMIADTPVRTDMVERVSCLKRWFARTPNHLFDVVAIDCGIKYNIIRSLNAYGCNVTIVPYNTSVEEIEAFNPDGLFLSNGPGNPESVKQVIETVRRMRGRIPIFGICLGHQMIALAYGANTYKMKFGHRGGNHPVMRLADGKVEITSQNHGYAVDAESLKGTPLHPTHINLLDSTVEGLECPEDMVFSVQYHPESAPGPQDSTYLFDKFIEMMRRNGNA